MNDLVRLSNLKALLSRDDQLAILAGQNRQCPAYRFDPVGIVGPVGADLDALVAQDRALQAARGFGQRSAVSLPGRRVTGVLLHSTGQMFDGRSQLTFLVIGAAETVPQQRAVLASGLQAEFEDLE